VPWNTSSPIHQGEIEFVVLLPKRRHAPLFAAVRIGAADAINAAELKRGVLRVRFIDRWRCRLLIFGLSLRAFRPEDEIAEKG
jgi:hypothetical protein